MASCLKMMKRITKEETRFMKNGRILLEELITSCDGKYNPIRTFPAKEFEGSPFLDIVTGTQMSTHSNVLKLIGCCFATEHPILVYEFVGSETLPYYISSTNEIQPRPLSWKCFDKARENGFIVKLVMCFISYEIVSMILSTIVSTILSRDRVYDLIDNQQMIEIVDSAISREEISRSNNCKLLQNLLIVA
ncbi:PREDICTED: wall-associated receptor kinase-like 8 [Populus euphratica]|uniref:Wall-associated receptor kinase-like 8 n=1 Tax=Populus euphratica TaxID=75702 RepID=A0AAJ6UX22_POPEU|nr:PREDICTED: wall-associated receptor kinase-like 8 [Populus euphratica]